MSFQGFGLLVDDRPCSQADRCLRKHDDLQMKRIKCDIKDFDPAGVSSLGACETSKASGEKNDRSKQTSQEPQKDHSISDKVPPLQEFELVSWMTGWALCGHIAPAGQGTEDPGDGQELVSCADDTDKRRAISISSDRDQIAIETADGSGAPTSPS
eukprot:scaffold295680_cov48-Prasinocladus_malaysianus.AAC.2